MSTALATGEFDAIRAQVREQREALEALEARLMAVPPPAPATPSEAVLLNARQGRITRNEMRRAARKLRAASESTIWVTQLPGGSALNRELAGARHEIWCTCDEAIRAWQNGDTDSALTGIEQVIRVETAIQAVIDDVPLHPQWNSLVSDLTSASDALIAAAHEAQLALTGRRPGSAAGIHARMLGAQSRWLIFWRVFVQLAAHGTPARAA